MYKTEIFKYSKRIVSSPGHIYLEFILFYQTQGDLHA